jgi:hypothetical protein
VRVAAGVALLLASGCREVRPGRLSPARGSSLSVFHRMALALILRTGLRVGLGRGAQSYRASVEGQPADRRGRAPNTISVDRAAGAVGPTISSGLKKRPRLSSHKFQSHGNAQAHRRSYSNCYFITIYYCTFKLLSW